MTVTFVRLTELCLINYTKVYTFQSGALHCDIIKDLQPRNDEVLRSSIHQFY